MSRKLALALEEEGRNAEAVGYLYRMEYSSMGIYGLPHEAGMAFLKDAARIVSSNDMCYTTNFDRARLYAQNAVDLEPDDAEAREVLRDIDAKALRYYGDVIAVSSLEPGKVTLESISAEWLMERAKAEKALSDEDLAAAFEIVWNIIKKFVFVIPEGASDYLEWLTSHIARLESAGVLSERAADVRREIFAWIPLFKETGAKIAPEFVHIAEEPATTLMQPLAEQGIEV